ncbi:hypothetical protein E6W39_09855 [Kitasatospora acidiphila]|uniref:Uncharacterized protein n=1 Tax=Kitasatospora acidiphila TaxID=2567942 RepID=A0A540W0L2_9ACTN|nr:hypothetical protein [Kitasatospora acidiphila]TQF02523.1 hypothetical protein E6W39_09855 [Kitasatospora acidiphila]
MPPSPTSPLLKYRTSTSPAPLHADADSPTRVTINLAVLPGNQAAHCSRIEIAVPADDARDRAYFSQQPVPSSSSSDWTFSVQKASGQKLKLPGAPAGEYYLITFQLKNAQKDLINYPLNFGLSGDLLSSGGPLVYRILEHSKTSAPAKYTQKFSKLSLTVVEPAFYLHSFLARGSQAPTSAPLTSFKAGSPIHLSWSSNGTYFQLYDGKSTSPVQEGPAASFTLPNGITGDTTFIVAATVLSGTQGAANGFTPVYQYATLTLTVPDPTLDALTVRNSITTQSALTVNGPLSANGPLYAYSNLTVSDGGRTKFTSVNVNGVRVTGDLTVDSGLTVTEDLVANGPVYANKDLNVGYRGTTKFTSIGADGLHVTRELTVDSGLTVAGTVIAHGTLYANKDFNVADGGTTKFTSIGASGLRVAGDLTVDSGLSVAKNVVAHGTLYAKNDLNVEYGGTTKFTSVGANGLHITKELTVDGNLHAKKGVS